MSPIGGIRDFFAAWRGMSAFLGLAPEDRAIVFYAEDRASWVHFEPLVRALTTSMGRTVCYLTSVADDPLLQGGDERIRPFFVGQGMIRTWLFLRLEADVLVMTMPDLGNYHIDRSRVHPVHYVYVFHSIVSTHMIYREGAFDHFDTILCVGPHHVEEIRQTEQAYGLPAKALLEHGYGNLDALLARSRSAGGANGAARPASAPAGGKRVLLAPSWGLTCILETCGREVVDRLLDAGHRVTVRPHPMTARNWPHVIADLRQRFGSCERFALETDVALFDSLFASDAMISDWSGVALEYAFGVGRPVLFIDTPRKVNNPAWEKVAAVPVEVSLRERLGVVVPPEALDTLPGHLERLCAEVEAFTPRLEEARQETVFNVGASGEVGAAHIARIADEIRERGRRA